MVQAADACMYRAQAGGRDRVHLETVAGAADERLTGA
jgi:hypothetical protein